jgi:putative FmdB family regulatory protein
MLQFVIGPLKPNCDPEVFRMPLYEYECSACGQTFEFRQSMKDDPLTDCTLEGGCGAQGTLKRLIGAGGGLIFKGSGFYITDYKKSNVSPATSHAHSKPTAETCASCPSAAQGTCPGAKDA